MINTLHSTFSVSDINGNRSHNDELTVNEPLFMNLTKLRDKGHISCWLV